MQFNCVGDRVSTFVSLPSCTLKRVDIQTLQEPTFLVELIFQTNIKVLRHRSSVKLFQILLLHIVTPEWDLI